VILDEIGRGTSTFDGLSIAWAVAECLHDFENRGIKTLFATHYHELTELGHTRSRVKNYNVAVKEWQSEILFFHKLIPGAANRSYGIQVAQLAGMPEKVTRRARVILGRLERGESSPVRGVVAAPRRNREPWGFGPRGRAPASYVQFLPGMAEGGDPVPGSQPFDSHGRFAEAF